MSNNLQKKRCHLYTEYKNCIDDGLKIANRLKVIEDYILNTKVIYNVVELEDIILNNGKPCSLKIQNIIEPLEIKNTINGILYEILINNNKNISEEYNMWVLVRGYTKYGELLTYGDRYLINLKTSEIVDLKYKSYIKIWAPYSKNSVIGYDYCYLTYGKDDTTILNSNSFHTITTVRVKAIALFKNNYSINNVINHIDENKYNNCVNNLEFITYRANNKYSRCKKIQIINLYINNEKLRFDSIHLATDYIFENKLLPNTPINKISNLICICCNKIISTIGNNIKCEFDISTDKEVHLKNIRNCNIKIQDIETKYTQIFLKKSQAVDFMKNNKLSNLSKKSIVRYLPTEINDKDKPTNINNTYNVWLMPTAIRLWGDT